MTSSSIKKPEPPPPKPKPAFDEQVEANRDRVRELEARGYLPAQISAVTRLPYAVVEACLAPAKPKKPIQKKGPRK